MTLTRPVFPEVTCVRCRTVYFVTSEARLRSIGYDDARIDAYRRCRCGSSDFVPSREGDAPELATLTAIVTSVVDPQLVAAYEQWRADLERDDRGDVKSRCGDGP